MPPAPHPLAMDRRTFLAGVCCSGLATLAAPVLRLARVPGRSKLVFVLLRGGFDGLAAVVPFNDPDYRRMRGELTYPVEDLTRLDGDFALAPGLSPLKALWDADQLVALQAVAIPYRTRSHFDAQAILETGLERPEGGADGWLNRLLQVLEGERAGIAVAAGLPRSMMGAHAVSTWSPASLGVAEGAYLEQLGLLYRRDPALSDSFEAALQMKDALPEMDDEMGGRVGRQQEAATLQAAATFLREPGGPNVAALEFSGWDTHTNQGLGGGQLDRLFERLAAGLVGFRDALGDAWADTTVVVMTEFGRTARPNGTGGTDHGTAGAGLLLGPRLATSRVVADWPGLSHRALHEGRDLAGTLDTRAVLRDVVTGVFDLSRKQADTVFPDTGGLRIPGNLMR